MINGNGKQRKKEKKSNHIVKFVILRSKCKTVVNAIKDKNN